MTLWRLTMREMRRRPGRAMLTLLSIAIGMAAVVSVTLGTTTSRAAYRQMYEEIAGRASLEVSAKGYTGLDKGLPERLSQIAGVKSAVPSVQRTAILRFGQRKLPVFVMGIDPAVDDKARNYEVRDGRFLESTKDKGGLLEISFAEGLGIKLGDEVKLLTPEGGRGLKTVRITGLLAPRGVAGFNKGGLLLLSLGQAQRFFTAAGKLTHVDLVLNDDADVAAVTQEVKRLVPAEADVHPPAMRTQLAQGTQTIIDWGLTFASTLAVVLGIFIIVNTFLMNVSERRRQIAILRAVGATRRQIIAMLLLESLTMGVVGTILGCLIGWGGGYVLMSAITRLFVATPPPVVFQPWAFILAGILGPAVAVAAAAVPAFLTTQISPLEAMLAAIPQREGHVSRRVTTVGIILVIVSGIMSVASVHGYLPSELSIPVGVMFMAMFVLLIPWLVNPLGRFVAWVFSPIVRLEGRLAQRQIRRRPMRTALTIGVLYIAVAVCVGLGTTIINSVDEVRNWYNRTVICDYLLRAAPVDTATAQAIELPPEVETELHQVPGITDLEALNFFGARAQDQSVMVVTREFKGKELGLDLFDADPEVVRGDLQKGEVVIGTVLAKRTGLAPGDEVTIETAKGGQKLRIAAVAVDYMVGGYIVYMHRSVGERLFGLKGANTFLISAADGARDEVHAALEQISDKNSLMLQSFAEVRRNLDRIMAGVVGSLWGILVLGFVVSAFGIANTLTMNVLEQTRELALLRVVAMTRKQVRRMVLSQAGIIGLIGIALGISAGISSAFFISRAMMPVLGYPAPFLLHGSLLGGSLVTGMVLVLIAAFVPAERAARLDLLIALQYE